MNIENTETKNTFRMRVRAFFSNESGAVTVDWVVLAAFLVLLGLGITVKISSAVDANMGSLSAILTEQGEEMDRLGASGDEDSGS